MGWFHLQALDNGGALRGYPLELCNRLWLLWTRGGGRWPRELDGGLKAPN